MRITFLAVLFCFPAVMGSFLQLDLTSVGNQGLVSSVCCCPCCHDVGTGLTTGSGGGTNVVPYTIKNGGIWSTSAPGTANTGSLGSPASVVIPIPGGQVGVSKVHFLIWSYWGSSTTVLTFTGLTNTFSVTLNGQTQYGDYNGAQFVEGSYPAISTTVDTFNRAGSCGMGAQHVSLPLAFATDTLVSITLRDTAAASGVQLDFLYAVTLEFSTGTE